MKKRKFVLSICLVLAVCLAGVSMFVACNNDGKGGGTGGGGTPASPSDFGITTPLDSAQVSGQKVLESSTAEDGLVMQWSGSNEQSFDNVTAWLRANGFGTSSTSPEIIGNQLYYTAEKVVGGKTVIAEAYYIKADMTIAGVAFHAGDLVVSVAPDELPGGGGGNTPGGGTTVIPSATWPTNLITAALGAPLPPYAGTATDGFEFNVTSSAVRTSIEIDVLDVLPAAVDSYNATLRAAGYVFDTDGGGYIGSTNGTNLEVFTSYGASMNGVPGSLRISARVITGGGNTPGGDDDTPTYTTETAWPAAKITEVIGTAIPAYNGAATQFNFYVSPTKVVSISALNVQQSELAAYESVLINNGYTLSSRSYVKPLPNSDKIIVKVTYGEASLSSTMTPNCLNFSVKLEKNSGEYTEWSQVAAQLALTFGENNIPAYAGNANTSYDFNNTSSGTVVSNGVTVIVTTDAEVDAYCTALTTAGFAGSRAAGFTKDVTINSASKKITVRFNTLSNGQINIAYGLERNGGEFSAWAQVEAKLAVKCGANNVPAFEGGTSFDFADNSVSVSGINIGVNIVTVYGATTENVRAYEAKLITNGFSESDISKDVTVNGAPKKIFVTVSNVYENKATITYRVEKNGGELSTWTQVAEKFNAAFAGANIPAYAGGTGTSFDFNDLSQTVAGITAIVNQVTVYKTSSQQAQTYEAALTSAGFTEEYEGMYWKNITSEKSLTFEVTVDYDGDDSSKYMITFRIEDNGTVSAVWPATELSTIFPGADLPAYSGTNAGFSIKNLSPSIGTDEIKYYALSVFGTTQAAADSYEQALATAGFTREYAGELNKNITANGHKFLLTVSFNYVERETLTIEVKSEDLGEASASWPSAIIEQKFSGAGIPAFTGGTSYAVTDLSQTVAGMDFPAIIITVNGSNAGNVAAFKTALIAAGFTEQDGEYEKTVGARVFNVSVNDSDTNSVTITIRSTPSAYL